MSELNIAATIENLNDVMTFVTSILEEMSCPVKEQMTIEIAVEEMFVNVAHYAYTTKTGMVRIKCLRWTIIKRLKFLLKTKASRSILWPKKIRIRHCQWKNGPSAVWAFIW